MKIKEFLRGKQTKYKILELHFKTFDVDIFEVFKAFDWGFNKVHFIFDCELFEKFMIQKSEEEKEIFKSLLLNDQYSERINFSLYSSRLSILTKHFPIKIDKRNRIKAERYLKELFDWKEVKDYNKCVQKHLDIIHRY